ncbi:MAG: glycosyltransferase family A protein [Anaerolineales bacterium]|nr:glycosyltransferase family 2 protein [Anaerolineales bacterium]MDW8447813.1 glycosyltransferase family A protein [Anaerolineales bacterium]
MRIGQNPAKFIGEVAQPKPITVAVITYIPFLAGYYAESLDVLEVCLGSIWQNTDLAYDLLVFDNASCPEVRSYLQEAHERGKIQFLWLSDKNIGKSGAWNILFGGAPGEIIAYADSDIYFYPGWLSALVRVLERFPSVGMVTGMPLWSPPEYADQTVRWARGTPEVELRQGRFLAWEDYWRHARSLGKTEAEARQHFESSQDTCLLYRGERYFVGAGHFQFVAKKQVLQQVLPLPSERPMGQVRALDIALNEKGYLRLSTAQWWVQHLGNTLRGLDLPSLAGAAEEGEGSKAHRRGLPSKLIRRWLIWLNHKTFEWLYQ